jgi:hypothetical protein
MEELSSMLIGFDVQLQSDKRLTPPAKVFIDVQYVDMHYAHLQKDAVKNVSC